MRRHAGDEEHTGIVLARGEGGVVSYGIGGTEKGAGEGNGFVRAVGSGLVAVEVSTEAEESRQ
jgi:hypothetical protein